MRKRLAVSALAPGRQILVDLKIELPGDLDERILIRRMQPAAADVEQDAGRGLNGMGAAADAVARFQHDKGEAGIFQRMRGAEACGAGPDDGDIDFGGEGHALGSSTFVVALEANRDTGVIIRERG